MTFSMITADTTSVHPLLSEWWNAHGWPAIPIDALPPICNLGLNGGTALSAVFVYEMTPVCAWMDYFVTDREGGIRAAANLKQLIETKTEELKSKGVKYIHTCCRQDSLGRLLVKSGYTETDTGVKNFLNTNI